MHLSRILSFKQFVKGLTYTQLLVSIVVLISGCNAPNRFNNSKLIQVYEARDQRNIELLTEFLQNPDETLRLEAARAFASMPDSVYTAVLVKRIFVEESPEVKMELAFSIGQTAGILATRPLIKDFDKLSTDELKEEVCIALAKCGHADFLLQQIKNKLLSNEKRAEAAFYLARAGKLKNPEFYPILVEGLKSDGIPAYYSAFAMLRSGLDLKGKSSELDAIISDIDNVDARFALLQTLGKTDSSAIGLLTKRFDQYASDQNYLDRIAIIRAAIKFNNAASIALLQKGLNDNNHHVRDQASIALVDRADQFELSYLLKQFNSENFALVKYRFASVLLKRPDFTAKDSLSSLIKKQYLSETDEYKQGYMVNALSGDFKNLEFLEEITFSTPSILLREFAYSALLKYRRSPDFAKYEQLWNANYKMPLTEHFAKVIQNAIETHDVSMVALSAELLRDTTLPMKYSAKMPVYFSNMQFMQNALSKLILPRDIEAFGELLKTVKMYEGKPVTGPIKPDYNNPIDWEYVQRIPQNQRIEFVTSAGSIEAELWVDDAPATVAWFLKLIEQDFYKLKRLHRVVPGFVIQDGCPRGDGYGSTMETIRSEFSRRCFDAGVLGMASAGPDTESCQWFITHNATPHLNGRYTAFGKVIQGMEVVHKLKIGDVIQEVKILP
jgi:cyclophilin family peptidyl-prolyl cis-trans isomerase/HEAT repeat protein